MRDLLNLIQKLEEDRTLSPGVITKYSERFDSFLNMIRTGTPFYTVDKQPVVADPDEADRFQELFDTDKFTGSLKLRLDTGEEIPFSKLLKTSELGGQASKGEEGEETGKEAALLKPSQIGITDRDIPASELGEAIVNNQTLQSTDYGRVVIEMAQTIMQGGNPIIPKSVPTKIKDSIVDYAGEYLGVLALVQGTSRFPRRKGFEEWLGGEISSLVINFPSKSNTNIADSFASIKNTETAHTVNISSKGQGGGAPPSISGLKVPDEIRNNPDYAVSVAFIDLCQSGKGAKYNLPEPATISQVFQAMNLLYQYVPEAIPEKFNDFLPWKADIIKQVTDSMKAFKQRKNLPMPEYQDLWTNIKFKNPSSDGGKLTHAVKLAVMQAVNEGKALPEFRDVILAVLDMNFVQQYADLDKKSGVLSFATQWPAKLKGKVTLESKSGATDPTKGGFSFKLSDDEPKTVLDQPNELGVGTDVVSPAKDKLEKAASKITGKAYTEPSISTRKVGDVGRRMR